MGRQQASHRQRHLEAAIASYRKAEAIDLDTELAEREAAVLAELAELAELASDTRRAATLRHQALELLVLAERLDLENRRERKRLQVAGNGREAEPAAMAGGQHPATPGASRRDGRGDRRDPSWAAGRA